MDEHGRRDRPYALQAGEGWTYRYGIDFTVKAGEIQAGSGAAFLEYVTRQGEEPPEHTHQTEDEMFYVLEGAVRFRCGEETFAVEQGGFIFLPRGVQHGYTIRSEGSVRLLVVTSPVREGPGGGWGGFVSDMELGQGELVAKPPVADIWALSDLTTPWCLHVAVTLRIAEHLEAGKNQIEELAEAAGCDPYALHRVLTTLAGKGVFEEPAPGRFVLNEAARPLLNPIVRVGFDLNSLGGRFAGAWGTLLSYVQTGEAAYARIFGRPFFDDLDAHPQLRADFDTIMGPAGHGIPNPDLPLSGGWEGVHSLVDVGGGTGAFLAEVLRLRPGVRGILVDSPGTVARSGETFQAAGVSDRARAAGQSFFDPLPAGADLYLLRKVLNDWPDREALAILRRCAEAARPHGRVVVLGSVTPDGAPRPLTIEMVLLGGKHRSLSEFRELAGQAGLEVVSAGQQAPSGHAPYSYFVIECRPV